MEQHPVPQNVTTFQFRLVGDMTIKQFGYLAGGIVVGYLCYKLPLPFFFTWPVAITSGLLGFGLAFVPVEERPMDIWIASFFRNVYSPTQWVWQKEKRGQTTPPAPTPQSTSHAVTPQVQAPAPASLASQYVVAKPHVSLLTQLVNAISALLASFIPALKAKSPMQLPSVPPSMPHAPQQTSVTPAHAPPSPPAPRAILSVHHAAGPLDWLKSVFRTTSKRPAPSLSPGYSFADALAAGSHPSVVGTRPDMNEPQRASPPAPTQASTPQPAVPVAPAASVTPAHPVHNERVVELQGQLSEALAQRERLEEELIAMRQQMDNQAKHSIPTPLRQASVVPAASAAPATSVRVIAPDAAAKAGLPRLTTFPNVVTGIVKDHYGNLLAGMLITVRDKDDVPLRALKTNKLGQFAASTPLPNNTYIVEIEDPKGSFLFDKVQIPLTGQVAPPIEVTAKSQKQVERDKLAKEIFGNQQNEFTMTKSQ